MIGRLLDRLQQLDDEHLWRLSTVSPGAFRVRLLGGMLTFTVVIFAESVVRGWGVPDLRGLALLGLVVLPLAAGVGREIGAVLWRVAVAGALAAGLLALGVVAWLVAPGAVVGVVVSLLRAGVGLDLPIEQPADASLQNRPDVIAIVVTPPHD